MVDAQALGHQVPDLAGLGRSDVLHGRLELVVVARVKETDTCVVGGLLIQHLRGGLGVTPGVDKDHDLVVLFQHLAHLLKGDLVDVVPGLFAVRLALDADEVLLERDRAEGSVKVEQAGFPVDTQEVGHVDVVGERSAEADDADQGLRALHLPLRPGHQRLQHGASLVVQHVHLVDDEKPHLLDQFRVARPLSRHNIPLLGRCHDDLCLDNLRLCQVHITRVLAATQPEPRQAPAELSGNLGRQRLHGGDVDDFEVVGLHGKVGGGVVLEWARRQVLADGVQDRQHGGVRLACTGRGADEHVLARLVGHRVHQALHAVERLVALEGVPAQPVHVGDLDEALARPERARLRCGHHVLLELFKLEPLGAGRQPVPSSGVAECVSGAVRLVHVWVVLLLLAGASQGRGLVLDILPPERLLPLGLGQQPRRLSRLLIPEALRGHSGNNLGPVRGQVDDEVQVVKPDQVGQ